MDTVWALVMDPQSPDTIYVGTSASVYKSDDTRSEWHTLKRTLLDETLTVLGEIDRIHRGTYAIIIPICRDWTRQETRHGG